MTTYYCRLDSYNEFVRMMIQEIVSDTDPIDLKPRHQYKTGDTEQIQYQIRFGQLSLGYPRFSEKDGEFDKLFPNDARLRNLTYESALYLDLEKTTINLGEDTTSETETTRLLIGKVRLA